jgi:hypothetical protein
LHLKGQTLPIGEKIMKTMLDQMTYESYSTQHYNKMAQTAADERRFRGDSMRSLPSKKNTGIAPVLRTRLAYAIALAVLGILSITRAVEAITGGGGGGGGNFLVK